MRTVLLTKKLPDSLIALLGTDTKTITIADQDETAFERALPECEALLLSTAFQMDAARIKQATRLRVISRTGVGVDNVDLAAASAAGIMVLNTPTANTETVAEHTVALILALVKQLAWMDRETRNGNFAIRRDNLGHDLAGKVLGLMGCGRIGQKVAKMVIGGFGLSVIAYDPYPQPVPGITFLDSADELCQKADIVSLHMPLLPTTENIISAERLALMKPEAYLVNTARGGLVDETALAKALRSGSLAGAALDVFGQEPLAQDHPLIDCPNTILSPHAAALTSECSQRVARQAMEGIAAYLSGQSPKHVVNRKQLA